MKKKLMCKCNILIWNRKPPMKWQFRNKWIFMKWFCLNLIALSLYPQNLTLNFSSFLWMGIVYCYDLKPIFDEKIYSYNSFCFTCHMDPFNCKVNYWCWLFADNHIRWVFTFLHWFSNKPFQRIKCQCIKEHPPLNNCNKRMDWFDYSSMDME